MPGLKILKNLEKLKIWGAIYHVNDRDDLL